MFRYCIITLLLNTYTVPPDYTQCISRETLGCFGKARDVSPKSYLREGRSARKTFHVSFRIDNCHARCLRNGLTCTHMHGQYFSKRFLPRERHMCNTDYNDYNDVSRYGSKLILKIVASMSFKRDSRMFLNPVAVNYFS